MSLASKRVCTILFIFSLRVGIYIHIYILNLCIYLLIYRYAHLLADDATQVCTYSRFTALVIHTHLHSASAYVSIRQHTPAYVSISQALEMQRPRHTHAPLPRLSAAAACLVGVEVLLLQHPKKHLLHTSAYVSIRQHTSAYVSIRHSTSLQVTSECQDRGIEYV